MCCSSYLFSIPLHSGSQTFEGCLVLFALAWRSPVPSKNESRRAFFNFNSGLHAHPLFLVAPFLMRFGAVDEYCYKVFCFYFKYGSYSSDLSLFVSLTDCSNFLLAYYIFVFIIYPVQNVTSGSPTKTQKNAYSRCLCNMQQGHLPYNPISS